MPRETEKAVKISLAQDRKVTVDAVKAQIREMCGSRLTLNRPIKLLQGYSIRRLAINNSSKITIRKKDMHQEHRVTSKLIQLGSQEKPCKPESIEKCIPSFPDKTLPSLECLITGLR